MNIYTDGGVAKVNPSPFAGAWAIVVTREDPITGEEKWVEDFGLIPGTEESPVSNNVAEFAAIARAVRFFAAEAALAVINDKGLPRVKICTDSQVAMGWMQNRLGVTRKYTAGCTKALLACERIGDLVSALDAAISWTEERPHLHLLDRIEFELLKGHPKPAQIAAGIASGRRVSIFNQRADSLCSMILKDYKEYMDAKADAIIEKLTAEGLVS